MVKLEAAETLPATIAARVETLRLSEPRFAAVPYQATTAVAAVKVSRQLVRLGVSEHDPAARPRG